MIAPQLKSEAKALPKEERKRILAEIPETVLHDYLAELFRAMHPEYWVEVTHGSDEFGKDLVVIRNDPLSPDVIGIVVKRGDIRAKTAGEVDQVKNRMELVLTGKGQRLTSEILSQIGQAQNHSAALKGHIRELKVNKVIVILAGEMSNNARARIEKEIGGNGQVYDLPWLVDAFTDYYPQVFFDGRAVDFLDELTRQLEKDSFYAKTGKTLSDCFVEPIVAQMDSTVSLDDANLAFHLRNKRIKFSQLGSIVREKRQTLIVGDPGSGKSKALAKLCIDSYRSVFRQLTRSGVAEHLFPIPLLITARRLHELGSASDLLDYLLPVQVRERFSIETLLVDGLDEVAAPQRTVVLEKARSFASALGTSLLVTSRKISALKSLPSGFELYELLPFEFSQAMKLVQKVLANIEVLPALRDGLEKVQAQIPMNPLSLLLLVELVAERKEVPSSITELYDRFLDLVFGRWDQEKGIEVLFEYVVKKRFLAALAYHEFQQKGRLELPAGDFDAFLSEYAKAYGWDDEKLRDFLKEVERAGILQIQDEVFFRHRSFLDYFVGLHIFEQRANLGNLNGVVTNLYFDSVWTEVAFFFAGLGREVSQELLAEVLGFKREGRDLPIEKLLAGRLLQAGWHSTAKVKDAGVRNVRRS